MTFDEFGRWLIYHNSLFPGIGDWLNAPERIETMNQWYGAFEGVDLETAQGASAHIWRLPSNRKPQGYSAHPGDMLNWITEQRRYASETYSGDKSQYAVRCGLCCNGGLVPVILTDGTEGVISSGRNGQEIKRTVHVVAACACPAGRRYLREGSPFVLYDGARMRPERRSEPDRARMLEMADLAETRGDLRWAGLIRRLLNREISCRDFTDSLFGAA